MTTKLLVKLIWETKCMACEGTGLLYEVVFPITKENQEGHDCRDCKGKGKMYYRIGFSHARTYEEALDKLLVKRNIWGRIYKPEDKFILVWDTKGESGIDVTRAVDWRIRYWTAKEIYRLEQEEEDEYKIACVDFEVAN